VIKFLHENEQAKQILKTEVKIWNDVWKFPARTQTLLKQDALLIPFVTPCSDPPSQGEKEAAIIAVKKMANAGYLHDDLHWRHVGFYQKEGKLMAVLFDLIRVSRIPNTKISNAIKTMLNKLSLG